MSDDTIPSSVSERDMLKSKALLAFEAGAEALGHTIDFETIGEDIFCVAADYDGRYVGVMGVVRDGRHLVHTFWLGGHEYHSLLQAVLALTHGHTAAMARTDLE
jgi:hypothetical protein